MFSPTEANIRDSANFFALIEPPGGVLRPIDVSLQG
jgi:hypothetical protein